MESKWRQNLLDQGLNVRNCPTGIPHYGQTELIAELQTPVFQFGYPFEWIALFLRHDGVRIPCFTFNSEPGMWTLVQVIDLPVPAPTFPWYPVFPDTVP